MRLYFCCEFYPLPSSPLATWARQVSVIIVITGGVQIDLEMAGFIEESLLLVGTCVSGRHGGGPPDLGDWHGHHPYD